jgi:hypothetical protein
MATLKTKKPRAWTVQVEYLIPTYKNVTVEASSMEEAIERALEENDDWETATDCYDACSDPYPCWAEPGKDVRWGTRKLPRRFAREKKAMLRKYVEG